MTDEQKSLDYGVKNVCTNCAKLGECGKGVDCDFLRIVRNCYEEAIEIGREEVRTTETTFVNRLHFVENENAELKERLRIESQSLHEQCEIVSKQVEQIEKMKNRLNCTKYHYCLCKDKNCKDCKDWMLEE